MDTKILVVDDDREWNLLLKMQLERAGFHVQQAFDGEQALQKIAEQLPDLVILDIHMPVLDGWGVCERLRAQSTTSQLPIVILSSFTRPEDVERGKSFQVKRYLLKPCLPTVVIKNVRDIMPKIGAKP
jgi:DNA-binding response OmpR family regulator